jgi:hypothetical protein
MRVLLRRFKDARLAYAGVAGDNRQRSATGR